MLASERFGAITLASVLLSTAAGLAWSWFYIHLLLQSQQPCELTYMYASYSVVDMPSSELKGNATTALPPARSPNARNRTFPPHHPTPDWANDVAGIADRVRVAVEGLGHTNYKLWRYTGDGHVGPQRGSGLTLPVLFIPGNGGSHEMGRSFASETARRVSRLGLRAIEPVSVEWYLMDLEGEWSAFEGDVLEAQAQFTLAVMKHLATLHNITIATTTTTATTARGASRPGGETDADAQASSAGTGPGGAHAPAPPRRRLQLHPGLVVVGHSMGGVVAADALARAAEDPDLGPSLASLLLTLGSPHTRPPLPGHPSLQAFYERAAGRPRPVVPVVAVAGGAADVQVATELTDPAGLAPQGLLRHLVLPQLPGGWCVSAHNGLVWCNQLVGAVGQALVDMAQEAHPRLAAARKAAATLASPASRARAGGAQQPPDNPATAWAAAQGLDPQQLVAREEASAAGGRPRAAAGAEAGGGSPSGSALRTSWDWALGHVDRHTAHPAHTYMAEALAEAAAAPPPSWDAERSSADEVEDSNRSPPEQQQLQDLAVRALAPAVDGGAGCGGANLAWYLQYGKPQPVKGLLRLRSAELEGVRGTTTGHLVAWDLGGERPKGRSWGAAGPLGWEAIISGANPCSAFRAWLSVKIEYPAAGEAATATVGGNGGGGGEDPRQVLREAEAEARRALAGPARSMRHDVEVTGLATPLPAVAEAGLWRVRQRGEFYEIGQGRNYQSRAGWLLLLPPSLLLPLLERAGGPPLRDLGLGAAAAGPDGAEGPRATLTLTLWLAEPSYKPAFHLVAQPLPPARPEGSELVPLGLGLGLARLAPSGSLEGWARGANERQQPQPPPGRPGRSPHRPQLQQQRRKLVVPLRLPHLTPHPTSTLHRIDGPGPMANVIRWLGMYKYLAVRITWLGAAGRAGGGAGRAAGAGARGGKGVAAAGGGGEGEGGGGGCVFPTLILTGGRRFGATSIPARSVAALTAPANVLVQISTNRTLHSLAPCTTGPWGCAAVTAVLDPGCDYRLDMVPYGAERLTSLLLAHAGHLWLGAQLVALAAVAATTAAAARAAAQGSPVEAPRGHWGGWPVLPWEALVVLQAGLRHRRLLALLLATAVVAATAAALVPHPSDAPAAELTQHRCAGGPLGGAERPSFPGNATTGGSSVPAGSCSELGTPDLEQVAARAWPKLRLAAGVSGLCPQPHRHGCGWGPSSLGLLAPLGLLGPLALQQHPLIAPLALLASVSSVVPPAPHAAAATGELLSALDWAVLAATAVLLAWLLAAVAQVATVTAGVVQAGARLCWWLLVTLPYRLACLPFLIVRWGVLPMPRRGAARSGGGDRRARPAAASAAPGTAPGGSRAAAALWLVSLTVLPALAGAPSAVPGMALLSSALMLAMSLTAAPAAIQRMGASTEANNAAAVAAQGGAGRGSQQSAEDSRHLLELDRRRRMAWLLYYVAYGVCAAPAAATALRRLLTRPAGAAALMEALGQGASWGLARLQEGRGLEVLAWGLQRLTAFAAAVWDPVLRRDTAAGELLTAAQQAAGWAWARLQEGQWHEVLEHGWGYVFMQVMVAAAAAAEPRRPLSPPATAAGAVASGAGYLLAAMHCCALSWAGPRRPLLVRRRSCVRAVRHFLAVVAVAAGCWLLALAWWLGAVDAAHVAAGLGAAGQLLMT